MHVLNYCKEMPSPSMPDVFHLSKTECIMPHLFNLQRSPNIHGIETNLLMEKKKKKPVSQQLRSFSGSATSITLSMPWTSATPNYSIFLLSLPFTCCEHTLECHLLLLLCASRTLSHHPQHSHNLRRVSCCFPMSSLQPKSFFNCVLTFCNRLRSLRARTMLCYLYS